MELPDRFLTKLQGFLGSTPQKYRFSCCAISQAQAQLSSHVKVWLPEGTHLEALENACGWDPPSLPLHCTWQCVAIQNRVHSVSKRYERVRYASMQAKFLKDFHDRYIRT